MASVFSAFKIERVTRVCPFYAHELCYPIIFDGNMLFEKFN